MIKIYALLFELFNSVEIIVVQYILRNNIILMFDGNKEKRTSFDRVNLGLFFNPQVMLMLAK